VDQALLQKWEYHVEELSGHERIHDVLAQLGNAGWELVSVAGGNGADTTAAKTLRRKNDNLRAFFKRPTF
jgi:hypothetical protein